MVPLRLSGYTALFASFGTLLCCALPALLVTLGLGATVAWAVTELPWLPAVSRRKEWVFLGAGLLLLGNLAYVRVAVPRLRARGAVCPPDEAAACARADRWARTVLGVSLAVYLSGALVAFVLPLLLA
jgi:hypothetical protein